MNLPPSRIEQLINAPERHKVVETLGWQPGIWGAFFIIVACLFVLPAKETLIEIEEIIAGSSALVGLSLAAYEVWRRKNRTVLVKDNEHILVFRKCRLNLTLDPDEIKIVKAGLVTMLEIGVPLLICSVLFTAIGIMGMIRDKAVSIDYIIILFFGLACAASLGSAAWTRFSCAHLRVPIKDSRWMAEETVLVRNSRLNELFP